MEHNIGDDLFVCAETRGLAEVFKQSMADLRELCVACETESALITHKVATEISAHESPSEFRVPICVSSTPVVRIKTPQTVEQNQIENSRVRNRLRHHFCSARSRCNEETAFRFSDKFTQ